MQKIDSALSNRLAKMSFICSLLVVALHGYCGPEWVHRLTGVCDVAVPFFFVCSGFLFAGRMEEGGWYCRQLKIRARSLLAPYIFWNVARWAFVVLIGVAASCAGVRYDGVQRMGISVCEWWKILGFDLFEIPLGVFWFVRCLLVLAMISPIFLVLRRRILGAALLSFGWIAAGIFVCFYDVSFYGGWSLHAYYWIRAFIFFGTGVYLRFHQMPSVSCVWIKAVLVLLGCGLMLGGYQLLSWIGIPIFMLGCWSLTGAKSWPVWLTGCSFAIYTLHPFFGTIAGILMKVGGLPQDSSSVWLVKIVFMAAASIGAALLMKRILPRLSKFAFGGR